MHKLLERQLRRHLGSAISDDPRIARLLSAVDAAYVENDADRALLERSMELASNELVERNARLELELASIQRLEVELRQAEKLRAVGQLASGIAHEINTPIQYVGDSVEFIQSSMSCLLALWMSLRAAGPGNAAEVVARLQSMADDIDLEFIAEELPKALELTRDGVRRVAGIVSALKDFGRPDFRDKALADVNHCLRSTLLVAQNELKYVADVAVEFGDLPLVPCYPGELNQVLLNLLVNAAHAIAERFGPDGRGSIRAVTRLEHGQVLIRVSDDGIGIPPEHRTRVFEPFFTTKAIGVGSGQGLAIARSIIVEKHGGSLTFESAPGAGTTFEVRLPLEGDAVPVSRARRPEGGRA